MLKRVVFGESDVEPVGLSPCSVSGLGQVVCLAGPNGCGKTRYLRLLPKVIERARKMVGGGAKVFSSSWGVPREEQFLHVSFNPTTRPLLAKRSNSDEHAKVIRAAKSGVPHDIYAAMDVALTLAARALFNVDHPGIASEEGVRVGAQRASALSSTLKDVLGTNLEFGISDENEVVPKLFGRLLNWEELSAGQRTLLGWALSLHEHSGNWRERILLIDEPEAHLHADVCLSALDRVQAALAADGQMWVATHSLAVLAKMRLTNVYFVEQGRLVRAGPKLDDSLGRLLGGAQGRDRLSLFLADAATVTAHNFALESLAEPGVAAHAGSDPQEKQAAAVLEAERRKVRLLDFGAGRGRFCVALADANIGRSTFPEVVYTAYNDPRFIAPEHARECRYLVARHGGEYLDSLAAIAGRQFDRIMVCNTLHEIPPVEWPNLFALLAPFLSEDGEVWILEDQLIAIGELPHAAGFVVLAEEELRRLCGGRNVCATFAREGRISLMRVGRAEVESVSSKTVLDALQGVTKRCLEEIARLRAECSEQPAHRWGRKHMFFALMLSNAQLAIADITDIADKGGLDCLPAGVGLSSTEYDYPSFFDSDTREAVFVGQNLRSLAMGAVRFEAFADRFLEAESAFIRVVLATPAALSAVLPNAAAHVLSTLDLVENLQKRYGKRVSCHFHPAAISLSALIRDPANIGRAAAVLTPKWLTDNNSSARGFVVVTKNKAPAVFDAIVGHWESLIHERMSIDEARAQVDVGVTSRAT